MESIWEKGIKKPDFSSLDTDIKTDVLIIGGGLTGILCGHMLKESGIDCIIAEAKAICSGVTKNTTAKITCHHGAIFDSMIKRYGTEKAFLYVKANEEAIEKYRQMSKSIECDFEETDSYVYSLNDRGKIEREVYALNKLGYTAELTDSLPLPLNIAGAVKMKGQAQFHPLKFAYALAKELKIYENTEIIELNGNTAISNRGRIRAKKIIVATHFPFLNKHGAYFLKMYQHRSYVLALENSPEIHGIYVDEADKGLSFRNYKNMLLLGGGGHRTGKDGGGFKELRKFAAKNFPNAKEVCHYAAQDCKSLDDVAYIGQYSKNTPSLYTATGFNKWGMTNAMLSAAVLSDIVQGKKNEYSEVFSPSRNMLHKQLFINSGESILGLLNPITPRCTHLGCALKYNKQEHSWDCSCHGSRFTAEGRVINNPAMRSIDTKNHKL